MPIFGGKQIAELQRRLAIGEQQYQEARGEIARLSEELVRLSGELTAAQAGQANLQAFVDAHGGKAAWEADQAAEHARQALQQVRTQCAEQEQGIRADLERLINEEAALQEKLHPMRVQVKLEEAGFTEYDHPAKDSVELAAALRDLRKDVQMAVRSYSAVESLDDFEPPHTKSGRNKLAKDSARLALMAFNSQVDSIIEAASARNYEASLAKIFKAAEVVERQCTVTGVRVKPNYVELRARELQLAVDHLKAKQLEKELEKERKAELREQAKAERELQAERERLEKERQHYLNVLKTVEEIGDEAETARLKQQIVEIEKGINDVEKREANIRAGYVYVISNIGSFGERMVKIGMTRRLDPMDRVRELGDASVPFNFDVHALFFSDDAVGVETELHHRFAAKRVNRINARREFFYATPAEVRDALKDIAGNLLEFTEEPEAEQYRLSLEEARASAQC
ncbi:DUF4041 domain-containing protein [Actinomyces bouchesdurhonensis]|jgi:hypothetical protein|uniref:DUF4041 domain-containing protein n=1 Tax=Actinomyces bouchesdurhonensis TaxID=1852361 RepID=UPI0023F3194D|nr:DUF4041 domain-containing protein [Actinomyces bouchesdurhonensis]